LNGGGIPVDVFWPDGTIKNSEYPQEARAYVKKP
jgi:hypothetical protein